MAYVEEYLSYLGQLISSKDRGAKEVQRRLALLEKVLVPQAYNEGKTSIDLKRQVFDRCITPVVTYGCLAWSLTKAPRKLQVWQINIGRSIVNVRKRDRIKKCFDPERNKTYYHTEDDKIEQLEMGRASLSVR
ncbi:uncharacterized protein [Halyomorpha halys]|uniref:uncharacterized protein n=1 Tax=Halyomorpha halys TaxID=286706 RepID=UPI0034D24F8F